MIERIQKSEPALGVNLVSMKTGVKGVVSLRASLPAGGRFIRGSSSTATHTADMLEQGTRVMSKKEIADLLESSAINLDIAAGTSWVEISANLPVQKIETFVGVLAEMLRAPAFPKGELALLKARAIASVKDEKQHTRSQAWKELCRTFFAKEHPMFAAREDEEIEEIERVSAETLSAFHKKYYGLGSFNVCVAGDIGVNSWHKAVAKKFSGWDESKAVITPNTTSVVSTFSSRIVKVADKATADVFLGHPIIIDVRSRDFQALKLALYILGGDFVSRLMQEVREKRGLTYGIKATVAGVSEGDSGLFYMWATFAPSLLEKGLAATREVFEPFVGGGITAVELARAKQAMPGNYLVSLATSGGIATAMLSALETGRGLSFIDEYPKIIASLTLAEVTTAI